jgi:CHAD domain-containing protein
LTKAFDRLRAHGKRLEAMPDDARHEARKDLKTLRYLVDDFAPLFSARAVSPFRKRLRRLQDSLGQLNDLALAAARGEGGAPPEAEARRADALRRAAADWRALRKARPFW